MGIIEKMNKLNQRDPMVQNCMAAIQPNLNEQHDATVQLSKDILFDECSEAVLALYEKEAGIIPSSTLLSDRRSAVMAKWLSDGVPSLETIQRMADAWSYGKVLCTYSDLTIHVSFVDKGIPTGIDDLKAAIEEVKPAHLAVEYIYTYNTWKDIAGMTWAEASASTWEEIIAR